MTSIISTAAQAAYSVATYILGNVFIAEGMPGDAEKLVSKVSMNTFRLTLWYNT